MSAETDSLDLAITQLEARIVEITAQALPDVSVGGRTISTASYLATLNKALADLRIQRQQADGAFQVESIG